MQLSVIILNYNVSAFLEQCIISVQDAISTLHAEIIVVDNASPDDSCKMVKEKFPDIKLVENATNSGFPKGNNIGVAQAKGEYICILNPDTVVTSTTFIEMLHFSQTLDEKMGIIGCQLIDGAGNFLPESKRGIPTPTVAVSKIFGLYKIFPKNKRWNRYYAMDIKSNEISKVEILVGAFMFMKRELYLELGGFDENCFMYSDDIDLSYMALQAGYSNYYYGATSIIHYKGESTVRDSMYIKRFREAMEFFYKKHFKSNFLFSSLMKVGAQLFAISKSFKSSEAKIRSIDQYVLVSNDDLKKNILENKLQKSVDCIVKSDLNALFSQTFAYDKNIEIIFDNDFLSFTEIIGYMKLLRNKRITFKIWPKGSDFIIGSNDSNDRGQVIKLNN